MTYNGTAEEETGDNGTDGVGRVHQADELGVLLEIDVDPVEPVG